MGAAFIPVLSAWIGPGRHWRKCCILAGKWSGKPQHSGGSPVGRCHCSVLRAQFVHLSDNWYEEKQWELLQTHTSCSKPCCLLLFTFFLILIQLAAVYFLIVNTKSDFGQDRYYLTWSQALLPCRFLKNYYLPSLCSLKWHRTNTESFNPPLMSMERFSLIPVRIGFCPYLINSYKWIRFSLSFSHTYTHTHRTVQGSAILIFWHANK